MARKFDCFGITELMNPPFSILALFCLFLPLLSVYKFDARDNFTCPISLWILKCIKRSLFPFFLTQVMQRRLIRFDLGLCTENCKTSKISRTRIFCVFTFGENLKRSEVLNKKCKILFILNFECFLCVKSLSKSLIEYSYR